MKRKRTEEGPICDLKINGKENRWDDLYIL